MSTGPAGKLSKQRVEPSVWLQRLRITCGVSRTEERRWNKLIVFEVRLDSVFTDIPERPFAIQAAVHIGAFGLSAPVFAVERPGAVLRVVPVLHGC